MTDLSKYQTADEEPCAPCRERRHGDCTENYCTCDCPAAILAEQEVECCGLPVTDDGYCSHKASHPRQITPELLDKAVSAAASHADLRSQARAVLKAVL